MKTENTNYANKADEAETLKNTGETGDKVCNIFDMAANILEWTTEYSTAVVNNNSYHCTYRGGSFGNPDNYTANKWQYSATFVNGDFGFRPILYVKYD